MSTDNRLRQPKGTAVGGQFAPEPNSSAKAPVVLEVEDSQDQTDQTTPVRYEFERVVFVDPYPGVADDVIVGTVLCGRCGGTGYVTSPLDGGRCWGCIGVGNPPSYQQTAKQAREDERRRVKNENRRRREEVKEKLREEKFLQTLTTQDEVWGRFEELRISEHSSPILNELAFSLKRKGTLTDPQVKLGTKMLHEAVERQHRAQVEAKESEAEQQRLANLPELVEGRRVMTLKVLGTKLQESQWGVTTKMLVEDSQGRKLYGTLPRGLDGLESGDHVTFTASVSKSSDDPSFGFFARPQQASITKQQALNDLGEAAD